MRIERIENLADERVSAYRDVRERDVARRDGVFIAEGRFVVGVLAGARSLYGVESVLVTPVALAALGEVLAGLPDETPVYVAEQGVMSGVVGFDIHRGCLAAGRRAEGVDAEGLVGSLGVGDGGVDGRSVLVVLESLNNHDNIGGILRNAAAFGVDGVLLDRRCADPLYRKSIRVSMGGALVMRHARFSSWPGGLESLGRAGYTRVALTPDGGAPEIGEVGGTLRGLERVALMLGAEGPGLTGEAMEYADVRVRVPMRTDLVDSLNVAATSAVALHELTRGGGGGGGGGGR